MQLSYGLKAFGLYFIILGTLVWFTLDNAVERLNDSMRQSAESVMVDMANLVAEQIEQALAAQDDKQANKQPDKQLSDRAIKPAIDLFRGLKQRGLQARIYDVTKTEIDSSIVVTDASGQVIYDSTGQHIGQDFSRWNDIKLTLQGEYGARTSYIDQSRTEPDDPKAMYIAAPIKYGAKIIGVVSLAKPINSLETHLLAESKQLQQYAFLLLFLALVIGYVLSLWFTYSLNRISNYANAMAAGKQADAPEFMDSRLSQLSSAVTNLRTQVDGKQYVENYIHSLTHELKTPLTSIGATVELLQGEMPEPDRQRFLDNMANSNQRMARLVDRMLSLAQLESLTELVNVEQFDLTSTAQRLIDERGTVAAKTNVSFIISPSSPITGTGDRVLLSQALGNLLDNALRFCSPNSAITITLQQNHNSNSVTISNDGEHIPDYALNKIYDRFFSLPAQANESAKSTGLGLSFVREIMKLHKGSVLIINTEQGVDATLNWPTTN